MPASYYVEVKRYTDGYTANLFRYVNSFSEEIEFVAEGYARLISPREAYISICECNNIALVDVELVSYEGAWHGVEL